MADVNPGLHGNEMLLTQMKAYFGAVQDNLETKQRESIQSMMLELETLNQKAQSAVSKSDIEPIAKRMNEISNQMTQMAADAQKNQTVIDNWIADEAKRRNNFSEKGNFSSAWDDDIVEGLKDHSAIEKTMKEGGKMTFKLRPNRMNMEEKGIMTVS